LSIYFDILLSKLTFFYNGNMDNKKRKRFRVFLEGHIMSGALPPNPRSLNIMASTNPCCPAALPPGRCPETHKRGFLKKAPFETAKTLWLA
jgi:hypothetical protein